MGNIISNLRMGSSISTSFLHSPPFDIYFHSVLMGTRGCLLSARRLGIIYSVPMGIGQRWHSGEIKKNEKERMDNSGISLLKVKE